MYVDQEISDLKRRMTRLEHQVAFLLEHLGLDYPEEDDLGISPEIVELARRGDKMQAIKLYRQETGVSLRAAKEFVDSLAGR